MNTTERRFARALDDDEMREIVEAVNDAAERGTNSGIAAAVAFYRVAARALGHDSIDAMADALGGTFRAIDFAIPTSQWQAIGEMVAAVADRRVALDAINDLLDWMNSGPSSLEEQA